MRPSAYNVPIHDDCVHDSRECKARAASDQAWMNLGMLQKQKVNLAKHSGLYSKVKSATMVKRFLRDPEALS
jgi:hypothetical protein